MGYYEKQKVLLSPDRSGILCGWGSATKIQRRAGRMVVVKTKVYASKKSDGAFTKMPNPNVPAIPTTVEGQNVLANTKTLATGSWIRAVTTPSATLGETAAVFYDHKARPIRSAENNCLGGYTNTDSKLDAFSGQLQYSLVWL